MTSVPTDDAVTRIRTIPDPQEPVPLLARPTVWLFIAGMSTWIASTALALTHTWPLVLSIACNTVGAFILFTVSHEAAHNTISTRPEVNTWFGRFATLLFAPHASFSAWRFIHMQHHRFTNHTDGSDPDHYTNGGPKLLRPLRWITVDLQYVPFYLRRIRSRPQAELNELFVTLSLLIAVGIGIVAAGYGVELLLLYFLPIRLSILWLGWAFDYLPHHELTARPQDDKFRTTRNRIGMERLITPLLLYQNYHLVHHLHPVVPFYKYIAVWRRNEDEYLQRDPALSDVRGRALTADEYRRLRELQHSH